MFPEGFSLVRYHFATALYVADAEGFEPSSLAFQDCSVDPTCLGLQELPYQESRPTFLGLAPASKGHVQVGRHNRNRTDASEATRLSTLPLGYMPMTNSNPTDF